MHWEAVNPACHKQGLSQNTTTKLQPMEPQTDIAPEATNWSTGPASKLTSVCPCLIAAQQVSLGHWQPLVWHCNTQILDFQVQP
jgi:hypothetical protein